MERDGGKFNLFSKPENESEYQYDEVCIMFPKFLVKSKFNAAEALKTLGATEVFSEHCSPQELSWTKLQQEDQLQLAIFFMKQL